MLRPSHTADKMKLLVHLGKISVKKSAGFNATDKVHSLRLLTIMYLKIRYIFFSKVYVFISRFVPLSVTKEYINCLIFSS